MADLTLDQFMSGLLAGLALEGQRVVSIKGEAFYERVVNVFRLLESRKEHYGLETTFWIAQHRFHGDSPAVRQAISGAVKSHLVSLDNPEYQDMRLRITPEQARVLLKRIPGGEQLYRELAREFLESSGNVNVA